MREGLSFCFKALYLFLLSPWSPCAKLGLLGSVPYQTTQYGPTLGVSNPQLVLKLVKIFDPTAFTISYKQLMLGSSQLVFRAL